MEIKFKVDDAETIAKLRGLSIDAFVEQWADAVWELARKNAKEKLGGGKFSKKAADSIRVDVQGVNAEIYPGSGEWKAAVHAHTGGPVRSGNGKVLAIPTKWNDNKDDFASTYGENYFVVLRSKKRNRAYLFKNPGKGEKLGRPMFVLTPKTKPQKPRPWWPDEMQVQSETIRFFEDNF